MAAWPTKVRIASIASVLPPTVLTSLELEERVRQASPNVVFPASTIQRLTGVRERRVLAADRHVSDLAIEAGQLALQRAKCRIEDIDLLIFAAASSEITEPATVNIIGAALGATCAMFDIKNACNSFLNAMETAEALIRTKRYSCVLIVSGEAPSRVVRTAVTDMDGLRRAFAGYTLGDAGAAMVLRPSTDERGIVASTFMSKGEHWPLSAVLGGGSRYPRDPEKFYFEGETSGLKDIFLEFGPPIITTVLNDAGWTVDDPDVIITHQVSMKIFELIAKKMNFDRSKFIVALPELGNMVAASVVVGLDLADQQGRLQPGTKVLIIGLAAGVSIAPMAIVW